jgi:hypothetical protein
VTKYLITVSTTSRHGRTNLHTFGKLLEAEHLRWFLETPPSRKQVKERLTAHCRSECSRGLPRRAATSGMTSTTS